MPSFTNIFYASDHKIAVTERAHALLYFIPLTPQPFLTYLLAIIQVVIY